jgi:hypothetical protein
MFWKRLQKVDNLKPQFSISSHCLSSDFTNNFRDAVFILPKLSYNHFTLAHLQQF